MMQVFIVYFFKIVIIGMARGILSSMLLTQTMNLWRKFKLRKVTCLAMASIASLAASFTATPLEPGTQAVCARSRPPAIHPDTVNLVHALAAQPELMNLAYLRYIVGAPENERSQMALKSKNYYWYQEPKRQLLYQLHQDGPQTGVVTQSTFTITMPNSQLTTKEMERVFGHEHRRVFDHQSYPTDVYSFGPNTFVSFTQPHDTFRVSKIQVGYQGPPLPPPSYDAVYCAYNFGKNKALEAANKTGNWQEAMTWLRRDAAMRPRDPYVHLQMATAYRSGLMINEAISEYAKAAELGAGDPEVEKICRAAFVDMKIMPPHQHRGRHYLAGSDHLQGAAGL